MSDFSRVSDEVVDFVYNAHGGGGVLSDPEGVRDFLKRVEPLLVAPHVVYIVGKSTSQESTQDYVNGVLCRLLATERTLTETLDDLNSHGGSAIRTPSSQGTVINNTTGTVHGVHVQARDLYGGVNL